MSAFQDALLAISIRVKEAVAPTRPREGIEGALAAEVTGIHYALLGILFLAFGALWLWLGDPNETIMSRGNPVPAGNVIVLPLILGAVLLWYGLASARRPSARYFALSREQRDRDDAGSGAAGSQSMAPPRG